MCICDNLTVIICVLGGIFLLGIFTIIITTMIKCYLKKKLEQEEKIRKADIGICDLLKEIRDNCPIKKS